TSASWPNQTGTNAARRKPDSSSAGSTSTRPSTPSSTGGSRTRSRSWRSCRSPACCEPKPRAGPWTCDRSRRRAGSSTAVPPTAAGPKSSPTGIPRRLRPARTERHGAARSRTSAAGAARRPAPGLRVVPDLPALRARPVAELHRRPRPGPRPVRDLAGRCGDQPPRRGGPGTDRGLRSAPDRHGTGPADPGPRARGGASFPHLRPRRESRPHGPGLRGQPAAGGVAPAQGAHARRQDRKSTRLNSSHVSISYAVLCPRPRIPPLFPYTTLFRSIEAYGLHLIDTGLAPRTRARALVAVRRFHTFALAENLAPTDPASEVSPPQEGLRLPKALTLDD